MAILYMWEGLTATELGALFDIGEEAARSRLRRSRAKLKEIMEGIAESPALLESTLSDLEAWAGQIREQIAPDPR